MSWFSWWTRKIGPRRKESEESGGGDESKEEEGQKRVALIVGVTGIVGSALAEILVRDDTPGGPWKVYGVARRPKPEWLSHTPLHYIQCDVLDPSQASEKLSTLTDLTHLFWLTWVSRPSEEENCRDNGLMLQHVLHALLHTSPNFQHICLQTGGKHYTGAFEFAGQISPHDTPFHEDLPRLPVPNFYHTLEDIVFETVKKKENLTWSIHRPGPIFGFSPSGLMNLLGGVAAYASICKRESLPFRFPGNQFTWDNLFDASDAELIAEQEIWAATEANGKNEAFNIANGDVFKFKRFWQIYGEEFGLEVPTYEGLPFSLKEEMRDKGPVWDAIVAEHGLCSTKLEEVGNWWFVDMLLNLPMNSVMSMNKSKESGFFGFRNTEKSIRFWIEKMRQKKLIP